jgi:hypothetical protein
VQNGRGVAWSGSAHPVPWCYGATASPGEGFADALLLHAEQQQQCMYLPLLQCMYLPLLQRMYLPLLQRMYLPLLQRMYLPLLQRMYLPLQQRMYQDSGGHR